MTSIHPCPIPKCADPDDPDGNAPLIAEPLCGHHTSRVTQAITGALEGYDALGEAIGEASGSTSSTFTTGTKNPPLPINIHVRSCQEEMVRAFSLVEDTHRYAKGFTRRLRYGTERTTLVRGVTFALAHLEELLGEPYGVAFAVDLLRQSAAARRGLGLTRLVHRLPAPCPECDLMLLEREDGAEWVVCRGCRSRWDEATYTRLVLVLASDYRGAAA